MASQKAVRRKARVSKTAPSDSTAERPIRRASVSKGKTSKPRTSSPLVQSRVLLPGSERMAFVGGANYRSAFPSTKITISVVVRRKTPLPAASITGALRLSRAEFRTRHGADPAAVKRVRAFAESFNLSVQPGTPARGSCVVKLTGSVSNMTRAFGVTLMSTTVNGVSYRVREGGVLLPEELSSCVEAVLGLDNRPQAQSGARISPTDLSTSAVRAFNRPRTGPNVAYTPIQVSQLYGFPAGTYVSTQTIGIVELGGGYRNSDLSEYFKQLGRKPPIIRSISIDGAGNRPAASRAFDEEVALDIEVAASVAPGAKIAVYFAPNTDQGFIDAIDAAVQDSINQPSVISVSWGSAEINWTRQAMSVLNSACLAAAALGITITVAAGDGGSSGGINDGRNHVEFPASSPYVLACGGTTLHGTGATITSETVWNNLSDGGGASGGGVSDVFPLPSYQAGAGVPRSGNFAGRGVPDVAGNADPTTGYIIRVRGMNLTVGGTSAVAPLWAGLIAIANETNRQTAGFINPAIYKARARSAFHQIIIGNNGNYSARNDWDACTGLGSPVAPQLIRVLGTAFAKEPLHGIPERVASTRKRLDYPTAIVSDLGTTVSTPMVTNFTPLEDGTTTVRVFYATDREEFRSNNGPLSYGPQRTTSDYLHFGQCEVSIPKLHKLGALEHPSIFRLEFSPDPKKHIVLVGIKSLDEYIFFNSVRDAVSNSPTNDAFVFIHGYNVSFEDAARRTGQIAFDLDFVGAPILYSWPSNNAVAEYLRDEVNIEWSTLHFQMFLESVVARSGAKRIHLIAHSMGNRAVCNALNALSKVPWNHLKISHLVLAAPDIDAGVFRQLAEALRLIARNITLYESSKDKAILASKTVYGNPRAGEPILILPGIDTIDASTISTDFLSHSYFADNWQLLSDIHSMVSADKSPGQRFGLKKMTNFDGTYYAFKSAKM